MSGDRELITNEPDHTTTVRTKPCWICGQYSYINIPHDAWERHDQLDVPLDIAWPDGPAADKRLLLTGVHLACWSAEYPEDTGGN